METPRKDHPLVPPQPHQSWLEYAVVCFDVRSAAAGWMFDDDHRSKMDDIRQTLWAEFNDLRARAGRPPWQPPLYQLYGPD